MRRRTLLALGSTALSLSVAGCLDAIGSEAGGTPTESQPAPPPVDCSAASRPEPGPQSGADAVQPVQYPGQPPESLDDETAIEYAERFEEVYRTNEQIAEMDGLRRVSVSVVETRTFDAPEGAAVVRLRTHYSGTGGVGGTTPIEYDNWDVLVTYYLDPELVVRTETHRSSADTSTLDPDPWESGDPVACFD